MTKQTHKKYYALPIDKYADFLELTYRLIPKEKRKAYIERKKRVTPVQVKFQL